MKLIKWLINDLKKDWNTIRGLIKNPDDYNIDFSKIASPQCFFLFMVVALCCGLLVGAKYSQAIANEIIALKCQSEDYEKDECIISCLTEDEQMPNRTEILSVKDDRGFYNPSIIKVI